MSDDKKKAAEARQRESEVALLAEELFVMNYGVLTQADAFEEASRFIALKDHRWQALINPPKPVSE